jgi:hypothetical protein
MLLSAHKGYFIGNYLRILQTGRKFSAVSHTLLMLAKIVGQDKLFDRFDCVKNIIKLTDDWNTNLIQSVDK